MTKEIKNEEIKNEEVTSEVEESKQEVIITKDTEIATFSDHNTIKNINYETGEVSTMQKIDERNIMIKDPVTKKFSKKRLFPFYSTFDPQTQEEKINFYKKFVENDDIKTMSEHVGEKLSVVGVIREPYEKTDEDNGTFSYGVTVKLLDSEDNVWATSSKSVAIKTEEFEKLIGMCTFDNPWHIEILKKKSDISKYKYIDITLA